jgi:hypothetical protein
VTSSWQSTRLCNHIEPSQPSRPQSHSGADPFRADVDSYRELPTSPGSGRSGPASVVATRHLYEADGMLAPGPTEMLWVNTFHYRTICLRLRAEPA